MAFQIPADAGHLKKNRFEFKLGDETVSLPKLEFVPADADEYLNDAVGKGMPQREFVLGFVASIDAEIAQKMRDQKLTRFQVDALYEAWVAASKVDTGESSASERS